MIRTKKQRKVTIMNIALALAFFFSIFFIFSENANAQYNYDHVNVTTRVNITNAFPEILQMYIQDPITLNAGGIQTVFCNATIRDWNGFNDITSVNATFYYYLNESWHTDDDNEHYTNTSCVETDNDGVYIANYSCSFQVQYFAFNGTWTCNVTVEDNFGFMDSDNISTTINALYALNVTDVIDYGNLSVMDYSDNITATITNFGNTDINVSVLGYGLTEGDGIGLVCASGTNNISIEHQRFYNSLVEWNIKNPLSAVNQDMNLTLLKRVDDLTPVTWDTYWQLFVPPNPFGVCTGTVRFTATTI